jgi:hypothetical protein
MKPTTPKANKELSKLFADKRYCEHCGSSTTGKTCFNCGYEIPNRVFTEEQLLAIITSDKQRLLKGLMEQKGIVASNVAKKVPKELSNEQGLYWKGWLESMMEFNDQMESVIQNKLEGLS